MGSVERFGGVQGLIGVVSGSARRWEAGRRRAEEGAGSDAVGAFEVAGEMALVAKADLGCDLRDLSPGGQEQFLGAFDAATDEVLMRGGSDGSLEEAGEVKRAQSGDTGERFEGDILGEMLLDVVEHESEGPSAEAAIFFADRLLGEGVVADEMDGERVDERLAVPTTARVSRLDFGAQREGQTSDQRVIDGDLAAQLEAFGLNDLVGRPDQQARVEGNDEKIAGIPVSDGHRLQRGEQADSARGDVEGVGLALDPLLHAGGAIELHHHVMMERGFVGDIDGTSGELLDREPGPGGVAAGEDRGSGHVGAGTACERVHQTWGGEARGRLGHGGQGNRRIDVRHLIRHRQALVHHAGTSVIQNGIPPIF